jgi:sulfite dehydrogenase
MPNHSLQMHQRLKGKGTRYLAWIPGVIVAMLFCQVSEAGSDEGRVVKITLPLETGVFKADPGATLANAQCLTCHSIEYVSTQPPMPRPFWAASVKKMREKYGAAIPDEQVEPLVSYLARNYGVGESAGAVATTGDSKTGPSSGAPAKVENIAFNYGCVSCHNVNVKVVGPPFKDIVAKYKNDPAAHDRVLEQIRNGGSGKWGSAVMPPFPMIPEAEAQMLAKWVLQQSGTK